jgi:hypothetical protein
VRNADTRKAPQREPGSYARRSEAKGRNREKTREMAPVKKSRKITTRYSVYRVLSGVK